MMIENMICLIMRRLLGPTLILYSVFYQNERTAHKYNQPGYSKHPVATRTVSP